MLNAVVSSGYHFFRNTGNNLIPTGALSVSIMIRLFINKLKVYPVEGLNSKKLPYTGSFFFIMKVWL